jgi:hypothetical protein
MRTDPTETGGLFAGRRPGTAPIRYRALPQWGSASRRRADGTLANMLLAAMVLVSLLFWGPIPILCLWVGSQVDYQTGSVGFGILVAFLAVVAALFGALAVLTRIDAAWVLVRRAAGHDQRRGVLGRVFAITAIVGVTIFLLWFLVIHGPGSTVVSGQSGI